MGFDIGEYRMRTSADGSRVSVVPRVVEVGHHRRRLAQLTGIEADENQARRLLNSIEGHRSDLEQAQGGTIPDALAAYDWLSNVYSPTIAAIPTDLHTRLPDAEAFHQILEHRWYLSEAAGTDVGLEAAVHAYLADILPFAPVEESLLPDPEEALYEEAREPN